MRNTLLYCLMLLMTTVQAQQITGSAGLSPRQLEIKKEKGFDRITIEDRDFPAIPGYPELPVITQSYVLPFDAVITGLTITGDQKTQIPGNFNMYPTQSRIRVDNTNPPPFTSPLKAVYRQAVYPEIAAEILSDSYELGYHVVTVRIYPVQYLPIAGELYTRSISFSIDYTLSGAPQDIPKPETQSYRSAVLCKETIRDKIENKSDIDQFITGVRNIESPNITFLKNKENIKKNTKSRSSGDVSTSMQEIITPDYLIITNSELKPEFEKLAEWKRQKGVPTRIKLVEDIAHEYGGIDLPEKIRNYLKEVEKKWGPGKFVLLGGDVNVVPARMIFHRTTERIDLVTVDTTDVMKPTDLYFASTGGTWDKNRNGVFRDPTDNLSFGETNQVWFLGRLPAKNREEAQRIITRIIRYEKAENIPDMNYFRNHSAAVSYLVYNKTYNYYYENQMSTVKTAYDINKINTRWLLNDDYQGKSKPLYTEFVSGVNGEMNKVNFWKALNDSIPQIGHTHIFYHIMFI